VKKSPEPICQNRHCLEDAPDMIERWDRKRFIEYTCKSCGQSWVVAKPMEE